MDPDELSQVLSEGRRDRNSREPAIVHAKKKIAADWESRSGSDDRIDSTYRTQRGRQTPVIVCPITIRNPVRRVDTHAIETAAEITTLNDISVTER